ncbi:MAG: hypothetical protein D6808_02075, partial [Candidatus Dadabacteria bacterium]
MSFYDQKGKMEPVYHPSGPDRTKREPQEEDDSLKGASLPKCGTRASWACRFLWIAVSYLLPAQETLANASESV